ncbi:MAG: hypothetical protein IE927_07695 [Rhodobacterales bacterium]|nr:hypothetical protein [Rhodobacterales bacterium]
MSSLASLADCLGQALAGLAPVADTHLPLAQARGVVLARDLTVPADLPARAQALRAGLAVPALDLMGASPQMPLPLPARHPVTPGAALPPGCDAVLPEEDVDPLGPMALRTPGPGEGVRLAGQDARAGLVIAPAGAALTARAALVAGLAGLDRAAVRRPGVAIDLPDPVLADFAAAWARDQGAEVGADRVDLLLRATPTHRPRLALTPGDTAWLARVDGRLVLDLPPRFDGLMAALLALGLPALAALSGRLAPPRPVALGRKLTSAIGLTELALLTPGPEGWLPEAAGTITLAGLTRARAFTLVPPGAEGFAAGATVPAQPLDAEGMPT